MAVQPVDSLEAIRVSVPTLVDLNRAAAGLTLRDVRLNAQMAGDYLSRFKGRGMEFAESRPYEQGDDVRNLHWRVMARTGKPFTKQFREERERPVFVWVDLRNRMFFGTRGAYKAVVAARAAALVAWAADRHGDRIGGVIFSDGVHREIKPGRGKAAVLRILKSIVDHPAWDRHDRSADDDRSAREAMIRLRRVVRPGSLIFLFSDFANLDSVTETNLADLARHNDLTLMQIHDRFEAELPLPGSYRVSDGVDEFVMDTTDSRYRALHQKRFEAHLDHLRELARRHRMSCLFCRTDEDPARVLRQGLGLGQSA
jgi:uncharacterized protein (DUF58 family)